MEAEAVKFEVNIITRSVVKAKDPQPDFHHNTLKLSNLDLLSGRFPVTYFYLYCNVQSVFDIEALKTSLAKTLNRFYPFAGKINQNPDTNEPEILCNNGGALFVEAKANIPLKRLNFYNLTESLKGKLVSFDSDYNFPFQVQITHFTCGGVSMTFTFDHALGDATAFGMFLLSWAQFSQHKLVTCTPHHQRNIFRPRSPPTYHPSLDESFCRCSIQEILNIPQNNISIKRLYHIDASEISRLQQLACSNGEKRTKIEAFSAYIWKIMVSTIDDKMHEICKMGWLVDGRSRMRMTINNGNRDNSPITTSSNKHSYIGNVLSLAVGEASITKLKQDSISDIASSVHHWISKVTNEAHFLDLIDWIECHRPGLMLSRIVLGKDVRGVVISSGRRFPVAELNFGFGKPVLGSTYSSIDMIGVGYMNQRESAKCDGSWIVSAILWPELAAALEKDSVLEPMSATHLQL